jgi:hypothetical protein
MSALIVINNLFSPPFYFRCPQTVGMIIAIMYTASLTKQFFNKDPGISHGHGTKKK